MKRLTGFVAIGILMAASQSVVAASARGKGPEAQSGVSTPPADMRRAQAAETRSPPVLAVIGDAFAESVARGLTDRDAPETGWTVSDEASDDASLAGSDAADPAHLLQAWEKRAGQIDAAVLMLGRNDDGAWHDARGAPIAFGSPEWRSLYGARIEAVAAAFRDRHIPLLWVGLPVVRDPEQAQRYAAINEVVRDRAVKGGATYVDSWQAFTDDNGDYTATGPDVNGHSAILRWTNGWNFTRAGALKLASFVLPDLKRLHDRVRATEALATVPNANPDAFDQALSIDVNAQIRREAGLPVAPPSPVERRPAGPVLALTAAPISDHGVLLPLPAQPRTGPVEQAAEPSHPGRADDFTWPRP